MEQPAATANAAVDIFARAVTSMAKVVLVVDGAGTISEISALTAESTTAVVAVDSDVLFVEIQNTEQIT